MKTKGEAFFTLRRKETKQPSATFGVFELLSD